MKKRKINNKIIILIVFVLLLGCNSNNMHLTVGNLRGASHKEALNLMKQDLKDNDLRVVYVWLEISPYSFEEIIGVYVSRGSAKAWSARWSQGDEAAEPLIRQLTKEQLTAIEKAVLDLGKGSNWEAIPALDVPEYWLLQVTDDNAKKLYVGQWPHYGGHLDLAQTFRSVSK